ncbi:MAG TPA: hypothetical protein ENN97_06125 [Phycisphaerales bacterium]|nr:hypothetical protein [Phycisphaerales bacterium]
MTRYQIFNIAAVSFMLVFAGGVAMVVCWPEAPSAAAAADSSAAAGADTPRASGDSAQAVSAARPEHKAVEGASLSAEAGGAEWRDILDKITLLDTPSSSPTSSAPVNPVASGHVAAGAVSSESLLSGASASSAGDSTGSASASGGSSGQGGASGDSGDAGGTASTPSSGSSGGSGMSPGRARPDAPVEERGLIESVYTSNGAFLVETTGSRFEYAPGELKIYQGLNFQDKALLGTLTFESNLPFYKVSHDTERAIFQSAGNTITVRGDSLLTLDFSSTYNHTFETAFAVQHSLKQSHTVLLAGLHGRFELGSSIISNLKFDLNGSQSLKLNFKGSVTIKPLDRPMIFWTHNIYTDSPEALETALSSGLVTHVIMKRLHPYDCVLHQYAKAEPMLPHAVSLCRQYEVPVVLARNLWPSWRTRDTRESTLYRSDYYIQQIEQLRAEAEALEVGFIALDTEPYGDSPLKAVIKEQRNFSRRDLDILNSTIQTVIASIGKIDFIFPAGSNLLDHPYNLMAPMGRYRISEHTYYDDAAIHRNIKYPYEIVGAYIDTSKTNPTHSHLPLFLVDEILDRAELWIGTDGLFLWKESRGRTNHALNLAQQMRQWTRNNPIAP